MKLSTLLWGITFFQSKLSVFVTKTNADIKKKEEEVTKIKDEISIKEADVKKATAIEKNISKLLEEDDPKV